MLEHLTIDRSSTTDRVVAALRAQLLSGQLRAGTPLREAELSSALGVARSTVREALRMLTAEGLLVHQPHRGVAVRAISASELADLYRARIALEVGAIGRATRDRVGDLERSFEEYEAAVAAGHEALINDAHLAFHEAIIGLAGSARLQELGKELFDELRLGIVAANRRDADHRVQLTEHRELLELIRSRKTRRAGDAIAAHLERALDSVTRALES